MDDFMLHLQNIRCAQKALLLSVALLSFNALAKEADDDDGYFRIQGQAGWSYWDVDESVLGVTSGLDSENFVKPNDEETSFQGALGVAYLWPLACESDCDSFTWFPEVGLGVNLYFQSTQVNGDTWESPDPISNNYTFNMDIDTTRLMLDAYLTVLALEEWSWFALGGVGPSWNRVSYEDKPKEGIPEDSGVTIDEHTDTAFAWEVGTGIEYAVTPELAVSVMYLFTYYQDVTAGDTGDAGPGVDVDITAPTFDMNTQSILFGLTWAF